MGQMRGVVSNCLAAERNNDPNDCRNARDTDPNVAYFNYTMECWNTAGITDLTTAFYNQREFNKKLNCWDVSGVTSMNSMFFGAREFNQDISMWNVERVTHMSSMFDIQSGTFNQDLNGWDVSSVSHMNLMFRGLSFNQPFDNWDTAQVINFESMFQGNYDFNSDINSWNVERGARMQSMFRSCTAFNSPLKAWNLAEAQSTSHMFSGCQSFNQDINGWAMPNNRSPQQMFNGATSFNQCLSSFSFHEHTMFWQARYIWDHTACPYKPNHVDNYQDRYPPAPYCQDSANGCLPNRVLGEEIHPSSSLSSLSVTEAASIYKRKLNVGFLIVDKRSEETVENDGVINVADSVINEIEDGEISKDEETASVGHVITIITTPVSIVVATILLSVFA